MPKIYDEQQRKILRKCPALEHEGESSDKHAKHFRDAVIPAMTAVRESADALESLIPHEVWPLATYREMLFIK